MTLKLNLLSNSISYFREAVMYAQQEREDHNHWKFAITNVVQSMELGFKERLRRIHPVFIYESIDNPKKTVALGEAIKRIRNPSIGKITLSDRETKNIERAIALRNELTHFEFEGDQRQIEMKFAEIFSLMIFFYRNHLELAPDEILDRASHQRIIQLVKAKQELLRKATDHLSEKGIDAWNCPECKEWTFVPGDMQCCFCHHSENVVSCEYCGEDVLECDQISTADEFDWEIEEGLLVLNDDWGMPDTACPECFSRFQNEIKERRLQRHYEEEEQYHRYQMLR